MTENITTIYTLAATLNRLAREAAESSRKLEDFINLTSLPVFGGEEPADTTGVWSWDADHLLLSDGDRWYVVAR